MSVEVQNSSQSQPPLNRTPLREHSAHDLLSPLPVDATESLNSIVEKTPAEKLGDRTSLTSTILNSLPLPDTNESFSRWLRALAEHEIHFDTALEHELIAFSKRIELLRTENQSTETQHEILLEESQLIKKFCICATEAGHEGRMIQSLRLQTQHIQTAMDYLRLYLSDNPTASIGEINCVPEALDFDLRAILATIPYDNGLPRASTRAIIRESILQYGENVVDSLTNYPIPNRGLYTLPSIPEKLIDSALEAVRLFFAMDSGSPSAAEHVRLKFMGLGIAQAMNFQLKTLFRDSCLALEDPEKDLEKTNVIIVQTHFACQRVLNFTRRITTGINATSATADLAYETSLSSIKEEALRILNEIALSSEMFPKIIFNPRLSPFTSSLQGAFSYFIARNPNNSYRVLIPRALELGF